MRGCKILLEIFAKDKAKQSSDILSAIIVILSEAKNPQNTEQNFMDISPTAQYDNK